MTKKFRYQFDNAEDQKKFENLNRVALQWFFGTLLLIAGIMMFQIALKHFGVIDLMGPDGFNIERGFSTIFWLGPAALVIWLKVLPTIEESDKMKLQSNAHIYEVGK